MQRLTGSRVLVRVLLGACAAPILAVALTGCDHDERAPLWQVAGANPRNGPALMEKYGCGGCHDVPGVRGAHGTVGPPLHRFGDRLYVAGVLRNDPDNLVKWIRTPQAVVPGNAMPDLGVSAQDARDIADQTYALR